MRKLVGILGTKSCLELNDYIVVGFILLFLSYWKIIAQRKLEIQFEEKNQLELHFVPILSSVLKWSINILFLLIEQWELVSIIFFDASG